MKLSVVAVPAVVAVLAVVAGVAASPATAAEACPVPVLDGFNFTSLTASDVPCPEAREVALHVVRKGSGPADWSCSATVSGRHGGGIIVRWACLDQRMVSRKVDFTYVVV